MAAAEACDEGVGDNLWPCQWRFWRDNELQAGVCVRVCVSQWNPVVYETFPESRLLLQTRCVQISEATGLIRTHGKIWKLPPCQSNRGFTSLMVWADRHCKHCVTNEINYPLFTQIYERFITEKESHIFGCSEYGTLQQRPSISGPKNRTNNRTNPSWSNIQTHAYSIYGNPSGTMVRNWVHLHSQTV